MKENLLKFINTTTEEWHDDVASINEEFVDGNYKEVLSICKALKRKIENFKKNIQHEL
jgi:hypothetical protein